MHSELIIFVKKFREEIALEELIQYERISNVTLKSFILASINLEGDCQYLNFSWENFKIMNK
jgi:tRNA splicing endonuclease